MVPGSTARSSLAFKGRSSIGICSTLLRTVVFGVAMLTLARAASATYQMLKCYKSVLARGKLCCVCVWPFLHSLSALALIDLRRAQHMAVVVMSTMEPAGSELPHPWTFC